MGNTGAGPNYVYRQLIANLTQYGAGMPTLRVGGDYQDGAWWNPIGKPLPYAQGIYTNITPSTLAGLGTDARDLGQKMILGINLGANDVALAQNEARAMLSAIPRRDILGLEIGNEPDDYSIRVSYEKRDAHGRVIKRRYLRGRGFNGNQYLRQWGRVASGLRRVSRTVPLVGMAGYGEIVTPQRFLAREHKRVAFYTEHAYPMTACDRKGRAYTPGNNAYPTVKKLLGPVGAYNNVGQIKRGVASAHRWHKRYVIDEMNSIACFPRIQVSGSFAATLWALDEWFLQVALGVDGVNMHIDSPLKTPFQFSIVGPQKWAGAANPLYYAVLAFAATAGKHGRLLFSPTYLARTGAKGKVNARVWAVRSGRKLRVLVLNKDLTHSGTVRIAVPGSARVGQVARLTAPSVTALSGVTFAGQAVATPTFDGKLEGTRRTDPVKPHSGVYSFTMPRASAALLTIG